MGMFFVSQELHHFHSCRAQYHSVASGGTARNGSVSAGASTALACGSAGNAAARSLNLSVSVVLGFPFIVSLPQSSENSSSASRRVHLAPSVPMSALPSDSSGLELYLMPAPTLDAGAAALMQLTGPAPVPPLYAFGFFASRWGWSNESYIEGVLHAFRDDPLGALPGWARL